MKYKGLIITATGIAIAIILSQNPGFHEKVNSLTQLGYFGAFIAGIFFVSTFTVATALLVLLYLGEVQNPIIVALIASAGALLGDLVIFRFIKNSLIQEIQSILDIVPYFRKRHLLKITHHKHLAWFLPVIGAMIIASPFPDEIGISLMGISKISPIRFMIISYVLNTAGILGLLFLTGEVTA